MKIVALVLCLAVSLPLAAGRRRAASPGAGVLALEFVEIAGTGDDLLVAGSDAWVDLNTVSRSAGSADRSLKLRRHFGVRIVRRGGLPGGTATVTARLESHDGRASVRIDGRSLAALPVVIDPQATVGALTVHTLDIDIPDSVAAGPLATSISWEVTTR